MPRRKDPQHVVELVKWPDGQYSLRIRNTQNKKILFWTEKYKNMDHAGDVWEHLLAETKVKEIPMVLVKEPLQVSEVYPSGSYSDIVRDGTVE